MTPGKNFIGLILLFFFAALALFGCGHSGGNSNSGATIDLKATKGVALADGNDVVTVRAHVENADGTAGTDVTAAVLPNASLGLRPQLAGPDPCAGCRGDMNCDGQVNWLDINPFVLALSDPAGYAAFARPCFVVIKNRIDLRMRVVGVEDGNQNLARRGIEQWRPNCFARRKPAQRPGKRK